MKTLFFATALLATPVAAHAQTAMPASTYVMKAGASDLYEEQSSKLVLGSTKNPKIRDFANTMIHDHMKSTAEVKAAAKQSNLTPKPPMLDAEGRKNVAALRAASGTARDQLYVQQQKTAHEKALMLHQNYAASGSAPALKAAAAKIAPVVQHHIDMLAAL